MVNIIDETVEHVREQVGSDHVICGLSGGVDSSVVAALLHRAIGDQLTCVFVDHGMLRLDEAEQVVRTFRDQFHIDLVHVQAEERYLSLLAGVTDPEQKRRIIGTENHLRDAGPIAQMQEDELTMVASGIHPAHHLHVLAHMRQTQAPAVGSVSPHHRFCGGFSWHSH